MNLEELYKHAIDISQATFEETGNLTSLFLAETVEGKGMLIPCPWQNEDEKKMMLTAIRVVFLQERVTHYVHVSEAWTRTFSPEEAKKHWNGTNPKEVKDYEDKKEVMLVIGCDSEGCKYATMRDIDRPFDGSAPKLGKAEDMKPGDFQGRMSALLSA